MSTKTVQDMPINGRDFRQMLKLSPGVGVGNAPSINGSRSRGNNWHIDGADNVDAFQGYAAVNQGGVSGIPGALLPIEAVDQFSLQLRGEIYNITNDKNYANPGTTISNSTTFGLITNTRNGNSAPGLGFGEPRNVQLAVRLVW